MGLSPRQTSIARRGSMARPLDFGCPTDLCGSDPGPACMTPPTLETDPQAPSAGDPDLDAYHLLDVPVACAPAIASSLSAPTRRPSPYLPATPPRATT